MTLPGETIATGAMSVCPDCGVSVMETLGVMMSAAGYYIGTYCDCGPAYSRESGYYRHRDEAERDLPRIRAAVLGEGGGRP